MRLKVLTLLACILVTLGLCGASYSYWSDRPQMQGAITTGKWKANIGIRKTLAGSYTDPQTGIPLQEPTNLIAVAAGFPSRFKLTIYVENGGSTDLKNVVVTDSTKDVVAPREWYPVEGVSWRSSAPDGGEWDGIHFGRNELTWTIETLTPGEEACLTIWIETLQGPEGGYAPTGGDGGDGQDLVISEGSTVRATSPLARLYTTTDGITIKIIDDGTLENGMGLIGTALPLSTPWAADEYP